MKLVGTKICEMALSKEMPARLAVEAYEKFSFNEFDINNEWLSIELQNILMPPDKIVGERDAAA